MMGRWKTGSKVQTLIFDKSYFTRGEAKQWAKDNDFKMEKVDEAKNTYRLRQLSPSKFADMRTITLTEGVKAVVGPLKNPSRRRRRRRRNPPKVAYLVRNNYNWKTYDVDPPFEGYKQILIFRNDLDEETSNRRRGMYVYGVDEPVTAYAQLFNIGAAVKWEESGRLTELAYADVDTGTRGTGSYDNVFKEVLKELGYFYAGFKDDPKPEGIRTAQHPDLFDDESPMYLDWREMTKDQLVQAALEGQLSDDVIEAIEDEDSDLHSEIEDAAEEAREGRVQPIVDALNGEARWVQQYELDEGLEGYQDVFQDYLANAHLPDLFDEAMETLKNAGVEIEVDDDRALMEALEGTLRDPAAFEIDTTASRYVSGVYSYYVDEREWEVDSSFWDGGLWDDVEAAAEQYGWPRPSDEKTIENDVEASVYGLDDVLNDLYEDHTISSRMTLTVSIDTNIVWTYDVEMIESDFVDEAELLGGTEPLGKLIEKSGKDVDNVVYDDLPDGFYVADLPAEALPMEGRKLGICVGRKDMGYIGRVQRGEIKILSLRTAGGKPKFTIEVELDDAGNPEDIEQIKGKANRLPGFAAGAYGELTKPQEVEMLSKVVEDHLGFYPDDVADLRPGFRALEKWKQEQEQKPRKNPSYPKSIPVPKKVQKLAEKAYNEPWGGEWGCPI
jgi:hypothetical protein